MPPRDVAPRRSVCLRGCAAVLGVGLLLRYLLAARVSAVGEGAAPTRSAAVLQDPIDTTVGDPT